MGVLCKEKKEMPTISEQLGIFSSDDDRLKKSRDGKASRKALTTTTL